MIERVPFVSGANGERDDLVSRAEIERWWRTPALEERVGEFHFSLWKVDRPLLPKSPRFSRTFYTVLILGCIGLIAVGGWAASRVRQGDFLIGNVFVFGLASVVYLGPLLVAILRKRRPRAVGAPESPPEGIPAGAVAVLASVIHRGRNVGWLWFERDAMRFQGAGFDFRLRRKDFKAKGPLIKAFRGGMGVSLNRPKGISEYRLHLMPGMVNGGTFARDRAKWQDLAEGFAVWEGCSSTSEPSLFPPIRPVATLPERLGGATLLVPPLFMGGLLGFAALVLPIEPANGKPPPSPWALAFAGAALGLMWPLMLWSSGRAAKVYARDADRAALRKAQ